MEILLIKLGAMGDVLRTTSVLPGLREKYKKARISWLTKKESLPILKNNPYISDLYYMDKDVLNVLSKKKFDLIINLDEDYEACSVATQLAGTPDKIIGFYLDKNNKIRPTKTARTWFNMGALGPHPQNDILKKQNTRTYQQHMFDILEINPENYETFLKLTSEQEKFAREFARRYHIKEDDYVIGVNTGAGGRWPQKKWSVQKTAQLIDRLHKELNVKIILFGGREEIKRVDEIIALTHVPVINSGVGNNLEEFPALLSLCHLVVTSDSLGMHIALALKKKVVALFGPTSYNEIEMYGRGVKVYPKMDCLVCYKKYECEKKPNCMDNISVDMVFDAVKKLMKESVTVLITSFKEPDTIGRAIEAFIKQDILERKPDLQYEIVVAAPDKETAEVIKSYEKKYPHLVRYFKDPGKGKSYALNMILPKLKGDILILSDGDVYVSKNAVSEILKKFWLTHVGVVTGRVVSSSPKNTMLGYWSHLLADAGAHKVREEAYKKGEFIECTGYLFAFRNNVIKKIPLDVAEDTYIPYVFWEKGYKIAYASRAKVYVKNPATFREWLKQRVRTAKAHETLDKYVDTQLTKRVKSFSNEIKKGLLWALAYPSNLKELLWTFALFGARFYMWVLVYYHTRIKKQHYQDGWERIESTK